MKSPEDEVEAGVKSLIETVRDKAEFGNHSSRLNAAAAVAMIGAIGSCLLCISRRLADIHKQMQLEHKALLGPEADKVYSNAGIEARRAKE